MSEIALLHMACVFGDVVLGFLYPLPGLPLYSSKERPRVHV